MASPVKLTLQSLSQWAQLLAFIVVAVWAVAEIRSTTMSLGIEIRHLSSAIDTINARDEVQATLLSDHERRIYRMEGSR